MDPIDLTNILTDKHEGKWVVFSVDYNRVIAYSDSVEEIAQYSGEGIIMKLTSFEHPFSHYVRY